MGILIIIGVVIYIAIRCLLESCETPYDPGSLACKRPGAKHDFDRDYTKVISKQMSKREFQQNIRNGKYK